MAGWGFVVCVVSLVTTQPLARTISSRRKQVSEEDLVWFTLIIKTRRVHTIFNYAWTLCFWKIVQKLVAHDSLKPCSKDDLINLKLMGTRWLRGMGWLRETSWLEKELTDNNLNILVQIKNHFFLQVSFMTQLHNNRYSGNIR